MLLLSTPSVRLSSFPSAVCPVFLSSVCLVSCMQCLLDKPIITDDFLFSLSLADRRATARTTTVEPCSIQTKKKNGILCSVHRCMKCSMRCSTQGASHTSHLWPHRRCWGTSPSHPGSPPGRALSRSTLALVVTHPSPWGLATGGQAKVNGAKSAWGKEPNCGSPGAGSGEGSHVSIY